MEKLWKENHKECPWYHEGQCSGELYYNGHVNDPRYYDCDQDTCPIFFWIKLISSIK